MSRERQLHLLFPDLQLSKVLRQIRNEFLFFYRCTTCFVGRVFGLQRRQAYQHDIYAHGRRKFAASNRLLSHHISHAMLLDGLG